VVTKKWLCCVAVVALVASAGCVSKQIHEATKKGLQEKLVQVEATCDHLKTELEAAEAAKAEGAKAVAEMGKKLKTASASCDALREQVGKLTTAGKAKDTELGKLQKAAEVGGKALAAKSEALTKAQALVGPAEAIAKKATAEAAGLKRQLAAANKQLAGLKAECQALGKQIEALKKKPAAKPAGPAAK